MELLICKYCKTAVHITNKAKQCDCGSCTVAYTKPGSAPFYTGQGKLVLIEDGVINGKINDDFIALIMEDNSKIEMKIPGVSDRLTVHRQV